MVRTWALELKRAGITANAVIPVAATAMTATVPYFAAAVEADAEGEPMPAFFRHDLGFGTSDDVAGLIAYLASDAAAGVTGQAIGVGGDRIQVWSHPEPVADRVPRGRLDATTRSPPTSATEFGGRAAVGRREVPAAAGRAPAPAAPDRRRTADDPLRTRDRRRRASTAIDVHVHIEVDDHGHHSLPDDLVEAASRYFSADGPRPDLDSVAAYYRERRMAAVVFTVDAETQLGHAADLERRDRRGRGAQQRRAHPVRLGRPAPRRRASTGRGASSRSSGVRGFKFHPTVQGFDPSDEAHYPLYAAIQDAGVPALFHTGQTGIGAGLPGGRGLRLGLSNPMLLDPVAADFPDLQIIMAHPSVPWQDEALSVATHKHNTWIDLSGWSPKYFPAELVRYANSILKNRVLFGSDFPLLTPDRWIRDAEQTALKPEVMPGILKDNAARLLGLG